MKKTIGKVWIWITKQVYRINNERLRIGILQALPFYIASFIAGILAVVYARLFAAAEHLSFFLLEDKMWLIWLLAPGCFIVSAMLVSKLAPFSRGSGIPQVMAAIDLSEQRHSPAVRKLLGFRIIGIKMLSSLVLIFGGGAIGREGPTIQISASVFYIINRWIPASWPKIKLQNMIMTGAAAGLAAAFNTPLGGIVFAVEELAKTHIRYFRTALFSAVIIAGLTAQWLLGPYLYLGFPRVNNLSNYIIGAVILVACFAGLAGAFFSKAILQLATLKVRFGSRYPSFYWVLLCALVIAAIAYFINPVILGSGNEVMNPLLFANDKSIEWYVPFLRMLGPVVTFSAGGAGGIFAPSLSAGATIGAFVADYFQLTPSNANLLILAGMVAFLTGVTRTPFTAAILVLEMTDRHSVIFYLMLAAMVANLIALTVDRHSFYDHLKKQYQREVLATNILEKKNSEEN